MKPTFHSVNRLVKRWNNKVEEVLGVHLEPHLLIALATTLVILLQILLFLMLSPENTYCKSISSSVVGSNSRVDNETLPLIYVVTPTYDRLVQRAELTRLSQTLMLVPRLHWIIVEDSVSSTQSVSKFVSRLQTKFGFSSVTLLNEPTPNEFKLKPGDPDWKHPKGSWQRNKALQWLHQYRDYLDSNGVIYFADDDNTYDLELFDEMRYTKRVAVWPVGLVGGLLVERPIVTKDDTDNIPRVRGFNAKWEPNRRFPIDMAGFALSIRLFLSHPNATFSCNERVGYMETHFLSQFIDSPLDLEPKAAGCTRTLVWHTRTRNPVLHSEKKLKRLSSSGMDL